MFPSIANHGPTVWSVNYCFDGGFIRIEFTFDKLRRVFSGGFVKFTDNAGLNTEYFYLNKEIFTRAKNKKGARLGPLLVTE
jgi:hypothetical protein